MNVHFLTNTILKIWHTTCFLKRTSYFWCCSAEVLIQTIWSTKYDNYITFFRTVKLFRKSAFLEWPSMNLRMWQISQVNHKPNTSIIYRSRLSLSNIKIWYINKKILSIWHETQAQGKYIQRKKKGYWAQGPPTSPKKSPGKLISTFIVDFDIINGIYHVNIFSPFLSKWNIAVK